MVEFPALPLDTEWILKQRGVKNPVDPFKPYAYVREKERSGTGEIIDTGTIFLTNRECPFKCLMCDLWKNTLSEKVSEGIIPGQIAWGLRRMEGIRQLKLYNSGNFFDKQAIPENDHGEIAALLKNINTVIIENHPRLTDIRCLQFRDSLDGDLEVAMGLETVHPEVLPRLNKQMELKDFEKAVKFLKNNGIRTRAFILLKPPFLSEEEGIYWAERSIDYAFSVGVECCVVIPTRPGNGALDALMQEGYYDPPNIHSLEEVMEYGISLNAGRIFADLWDLDFFSSCDDCFEQRKARLERMNLYQEIKRDYLCECSKF
jgi:archaeosine synthase beta-subunit